VPTDALSEIKAYAQKNKLPSPTFKDLGESERSTDYRPEFIIECKLCDIARQGIGQSKQDARAYAARAVLDALLPKKEKPKADEKPKKKNPAQGKRKFSPKQNKKAR
jgi:dsRNA-specific ribonuclease